MNKSTAIHILRKLYTAKGILRVEVARTRINGHDTAEDHLADALTLVGSAIASINEDLER